MKDENLLKTPASYEQIYQDLLIACKQLPSQYSQELEDARTLMIMLASHWKELGNTLYKKKQYNEAIEAYQKALEIYGTPQHQGEQISLYSNLAITYNVMSSFPQAISMGQSALALSLQTSVSSSTALKEKIVFNLVKALSQQSKKLFEARQFTEADAYHLHAKEITLANQAMLSIKTEPQIMAWLADFETGHLLSVVQDKDAPSMSVASEPSGCFGLMTFFNRKSNDSDSSPVRKKQKRAETSLQTLQF